MIVSERNFLLRFSQLEALKQVQQNLDYHGEGTVYRHIELVYESLERLKEWSHLSEEKKQLLRYAAVFHDIGKQFCTRQEDGVFISPNHAVVGADKFWGIAYLYKEQFLELSFSQREQIAWYIRYHGLPALFLEKENPELWIRRAASVIDLELLYLLAKADFYGRVCSKKQEWLDKIEYFKEYAIELNCFHEIPTFCNSYTRLQYLRGAIKWYGESLYDTTTFPVYIMAGFPLAGKDSYIQEHFSDIPVVSLDQIREEYQISPKKNQKRVAMLAMEQAKNYLRKRQPYVWNATNINKQIRESIITLAENYGARVTLIYIESPYKQLLERNEKRERKVPEMVIRRYISIFQRISPWEADMVKQSIME